MKSNFPNINELTFSIVLLMGLVGCTSTSKLTDNSEKTLLKASLIEQDEVGRSFRDSIAKFAINNVPGSSGTVNLNAHSSFQVSVGGDYVAATGETCREIALARRSDVSIHSSVCKIKGVWQTIYVP